ncbi:hypothetical protein PoB_001764300 [Plakobranchus ocellatus]|uniref:Uncharacterized protein n=1 Tax=Plakobranchus ocellatus TaxID=259542 RepID=A0AAV3Z948_9GAST|nr:hypothetical protein PoB_001764300 [Plakobranchus ocellatus]
MFTGRDINNSTLFIRDKTPALPTSATSINSTLSIRDINTSILYTRDINNSSFSIRDINTSILYTRDINNSSFSIRDIITSTLSIKGINNSTLHEGHQQQQSPTTGILKTSTTSSSICILSLNSTFSPFLQTLINSRNTVAFLSLLQRGDIVKSTLNAVFSN